MELWQQLGFKSFGDWRRASERARKAEKKKAAAPASVIASAVAGHGCDVDTAPDPPDDVRVAWQPLRQLDPPSPHRVNSPYAAERLPGTLHEHVEVTPRGSRAHKIKHVSLGGTTRYEEYVSPAGARQKLEERNAWRLHVAAARRADPVTVIDKRDVHRYMRHERCGACETCLELSRFGGSKHRASAPCETVLSRLEYTESERAIVCDPTQRFAR